jgi:adenylate cyclase
MHEIERKFLIRGSIYNIVDTKAYAQARVIEQCYLDKTGDWTIRVRRYTNLLGDFLEAKQTMKRKVTDRKCIELEVSISQSEFEMVASLCGPMLRKRRWEVPHEGHVWHVDSFEQFDGLVVAEIELEHEDEEFVCPPWLGKEVTHKKRYRNRQMAQELAV